MFPRRTAFTIFWYQAQTSYWWLYPHYIYIIIHLLYYILYMYIFSILHHYILCISPLSPVNPHCDRRLLIHRSIDPAGSCRCLRAEWQCPCGFVEQAAGPLTLRGWDPAGRIWFQRYSHSSDMLLEMYIFYLLKRMTACMYIYIHIITYIPVVPHKAVAEVSEIGNL